ncbi:MAG: insulinase family protein [Armatimonadetes bacterium]|nr:insulinase family protein [Armatimonadota bacterium]
MTIRKPLLPLALLLGAAPFQAAPPAQSQRTVPAAFPTPQETSAADMIRQNLAAGKPISLNGIQEATLPNGLTVLTKEVHAAPVVYFSVYYKVGSVDEQVGQTGMSHLMEHMMFKGTRSRGPGVISSTLQNNGADFNASTSFDRTEYHETLASDRLELAMQIESDRMVNSLYDEAQHQKEMTVVRSEYEAGENDPGTALGKAVRLAAFQVNPYRWETIGFKADIENFTRDEMYAYYKNYYAPNNAVVVIVGDFDTARALDMARRYFGPIKPHPIAQHFITPEPDQEGERRVIVRRAGTAPQIEIDYHIPGFGDPDRYVIDVLETVLSAGRTSRLFQYLEQTGLAAGAEANDYGLRDPDLLFLSAVAQPGHTNADLEKALLAEVTHLQTTPISDEELTRAINQAEAGYIFGKDSVQEQGETLGENAMKGDWRFGETYLANLRKVTRADVQRVAQKYLTARNRTVGYFEPISPANGEAAPPPSLGGSATTPPVARFRPARVPPADYYRTPGTPSGSPRLATSPETGEDEGQGACASVHSPLSASGRVDRLAGTGGVLSGGTFDQNAKTPTPTRVVLPNGLTVIVQENHANPTISLSGAILSAGGVFDPPTQRGLADFTAEQLSRGTQRRSLLDIARALENVGATADVGGGEEYASLDGRSLTKDFPLMLDVLADELRRPTFPADELDKARAQALAGIEEARSETGALAQIAFDDALYPPGHPFHSPTLDEQAAFLKGVTRQDLVSFHAAHYAPDKMILTIVGDVSAQDAIAQVTKYFGDWPKKGNLPGIAIPDVPPAPGPARTVVIPVPDKAQVDVRYGYPGRLKRTDPDFYRVVVLNTILGGGTGLASRLATNVRDRMGLVYGIYAETAASLGEGPFEVEFGANPVNVDAAVAEMDRQLAALHDQGVTPQEVQQAVSFLTGSYPVTLSTNGAVAGQLLIAQIYGLGLDYIQKRNGYYRAITTDQVNAAAKKYLQPGTGALVIAGTYTGKYAPAK